MTLVYYRGILDAVFSEHYSDVAGQLSRFGFGTDKDAGFYEYVFAVSQSVRRSVIGPGSAGKSEIVCRQHLRSNLKDGYVLSIRAGYVPVGFGGFHIVRDIDHPDRIALCVYSLRVLR